MTLTSFEKRKFIEAFEREMEKQEEILFLVAESKREFWASSSEALNRRQLRRAEAQSQAKIEAYDAALAIIGYERLTYKDEKTGATTIEIVKH